MIEGLVRPGVDRLGRLTAEFHDAMGRREDVPVVEDGATAELVVRVHGYLVTDGVKRGETVALYDIGGRLVVARVVVGDVVLDARGYRGC